jgi:hypothetical protein
MRVTNERVEELDALLAQENGPDKVAYALYGANGAAIKELGKVAFGYWVGNSRGKTFVLRGEAFKPLGVPEFHGWKDALIRTLEADAKDTK